MSRLITPDSVGKERRRLTRALVLALRELAKQDGTPNALTRDLAAFMTLALEELAENVDRTVAPWEKRGYWLKADRFRLDWLWAEQVAKKLRQALADEDWASFAENAVHVGEKLKDVQVPARHGLGTPWQGAWSKYHQKSHSGY